MTKPKKTGSVSKSASYSDAVQNQESSKRYDAVIKYGNSVAGKIFSGKNAKKGTLFAWKSSIVNLGPEGMQTVVKSRNKTAVNDSSHGLFYYEPGMNNSVQVTNRNTLGTINAAVRGANNAAMANRNTLGTINAAVRGANNAAMAKKSITKKATSPIQAKKTGPAAR